MRSCTPRTVAALICIAAVIVPATPAHADRIRDDQWHLRYLNVAEAHKYSQGKGVTVAVIDTGVDPHPDLRTNLLPGIDLVPGGEDGRQDQDGHGTAMAGLIAAHGRDDDNGALGIAPRAQILPIRYNAISTNGDSENIAAGIEWAVARRAKIISISLGGGPSPQLRSAVEAARKADAIVIAAVGNRPANFGITFPAVIDGVVSVGATDRSGSHAPVSVAGKELVMSAPGVDIYSTSRNGKYYKGTGTSASTAIVAGAAALVRSKYPNLSAKEVIHRLTATATDKGAPGRDEEYGYGVLNLVAALTADVPPLDATAAPSASGPASLPPTAAALPVTDPAENARTTLVIALAALVVIGIVAMALVLRSRRPTS